VVGAEAVARFILGLFGQAARFAGPLLARPVLVDGALGWQMETVYRDGRTLRLVMAYAVHEGRITGVFNQLNPEKLPELPPFGPDDAWPPRW
jgi:RNA polymerase sigma-70 factor, ECF subfamily